MRRNPSTVVILSGEVAPGTLRAIDRSANVSLIRAESDDLAGAAGALARAAPFEIAASEAVAAWRAGTFELPDYYLVLTGTQPADPDFHLGPLRSQRPHRVAVAATPETADPASRAAEVLRVMGSLRHGPWWPPLDQIVSAARDFYPGSLAVSR